jgi:2,3-bisphosphoglycerate-independent phosphoglycerate mutase
MPKEPGTPSANPPSRATEASEVEGIYADALLAGGNYERQQAALEKFLDSLTDEKTQEEARALVQELSQVEKGITFQITFPKKREFSEIEPDFSTLKSTRESDVQEIQRGVIGLATLCKRYLRRPMTTDTLPNHMVRRGWFGKSLGGIMSRYISYHQANKLRYNNIAGLQEKIGYLRLLLTSRTGHPELDKKIAAGKHKRVVEWGKKEDLVAAFDSFPDMDDYGELNDTDQKLERIAQIDAFCERIIRLFSKAS